MRTGRARKITFLLCSVPSRMTSPTTCCTNKGARGRTQTPEEVGTLDFSDAELLDRHPSAPSHLAGDSNSEKVLTDTMRSVRKVGTNMVSKEDHVEDWAPPCRSAMSLVGICVWHALIVFAFVCTSLLIGLLFETQLTFTG